MENAVDPSWAPILLAGPTATGKSELALALAERVNGEIVSVDSMQVYRGMDIGTAKASLADRSRIPHHLIDILDVTQSFDAAQFCSRARAATQEIQGRGRRAILCGGTGLYFQAFLKGVGEGPPANKALRVRLEAQPLEDLLRELQVSDPVLYETIDRRNPRRVIRALEVIRLTGKPYSILRSNWDEAPAVPFMVATRPPGVLRQRIERRVDQMFEAGLVEETKHLLEEGLGENPTASQALGYRQVMEFLRHQRSLEQTIALVKVRTWQFAKRQMTWFRRTRGANWLTLQGGPEEDLPRLLELLTP